MNRSAEKQAIRSAFGDAASIYDDVAQIQRRIADALLARCTPDMPSPVLDAGCGTGYLARVFTTKHGGTPVLQLDASERMLAHAGPPALCGDIEHLPLQDVSIGTYLSSLAWQWTDIHLACREAARVLVPGGRLRVATLCEQSLHELRSAFRATDEAEHVRSFHRPEEIAAALAAAGLRARLTRQCFVAHAPAVRPLLRDIRSLGAHVLGRRRQGLFGRAAWARMEAAYETFRTRDGLPVSYDVVFIDAEKQ